MRAAASIERYEYQHDWREQRLTDHSGMMAKLARSRSGGSLWGRERLLPAQISKTKGIESGTSDKANCGLP